MWAAADLSECRRLLLAVLDAVYLDTWEARAVVSIRRNHVRGVKPGQDVEIVLEKYPGRILKGRVLFVINSTAQGQLAPSGMLPALRPEPGLPIAVRIEFVDDMSGLELMGGVAGTAAIYTDAGGPTHVIRKVMIRMDTWLNYLRGMSI